MGRTAYVFCVQRCNSISMIRRNCRVRRRVCDGYEEPAGTHEKFDQSTGGYFSPLDVEMVGQSLAPGGVVSTCPVEYATSVPTEKVQYSMNFECVG